MCMQTPFAKPCLPAWLQSLLSSQFWRISALSVDRCPACLQGMRETYGMYADTLRSQLGSTAPPTSAAMSTVVQHAEASGSRQQTVVVSSNCQQGCLCEAYCFLLTALHVQRLTCGRVLLAVCVCMCHSFALLAGCGHEMTACVLCRSC